MSEWLNQVVSPGFNAMLNGLSGLLLIVGYLTIKRRYITAHKACMLGALAVSAIFLASYLYLHLVIRGGKATEFAVQNPTAPPWIAWTYYTILLSHTLLAIVVAPLALVTAYLGLRDRLRKHIRIARWTLPLWIYVSATGVVVYWMLYRLYEPAL
jgi:uncharacterized membrane protein YozB (DUF420 family)